MDAKLLNFVRPDVPGELAAMVAKMMAKDPARRFQTPSEVAQALAPFFKKASANVRFRIRDLPGGPSGAEARITRQWVCADAARDEPGAGPDVPQPRNLR